MKHLCFILLLNKFILVIVVQNEISCSLDATSGKCNILRMCRKVTENSLNSRVSLTVPVYFFQYCFYLKLEIFRAFSCGEYSYSQAHSERLLQVNSCRSITSVYCALHVYWYRNSLTVNICQNGFYIVVLPEIEKFFCL